MTSSIRGQLKDTSGKIFALTGLGINISTPTELTSGLKLGRTGYIMLLEGDENILSNPRHKELNFKKKAQTQTSLHYRNW